ncbi:MAG: phage major capsid protein [Verrucomicrobia bacterium]|nr:phage major capsid protein [Verrucomicrobiota bacterium]
MKFKKYRNFIGLALIIMLAVALVNLGMSLDLGLFMVASWQLLQFARSRRPGYSFSTVLTPEQIAEFQQILMGMKSYSSLFESLPARLNSLEKDNNSMRADLNRYKKAGLAGLAGGGYGVRWVGNVPFVSDECAKALTSVFVLQCGQIDGALEHVVGDASARERIKGYAAANLGIETRTAMSGTEIPLPTVYVPQVVELVWKYGQARQYATVFPLGAGTVKLPRLKAGEDDFGYFGAGTAGMSQSITEKRVTAELVTFTANKGGGMIRIPYELEEDTFIPIGQFLARYIARQLAKLEDKTLFLADGTASYASQTGVGPYCAANPTYLLQLAGGKTKPSDATLADLRNLRGKVSAALLSGGFDAAYYINPTFEPMLRGFNQYPNFIIYENVNGKPTFDGWPVRWVGVTQPFLTVAAASTFIAFFGDLSYWYLGERGAPRVEISKEVFFATDELAMRALERIDVEAMGIDAMAALQTAAA